MSRQPKPDMKTHLFTAALIAVGVSLLAIAADQARTAPPRSPREHILQLRRELARHDELYHRQASPEIDDAAYDQLRRRLAQLERDFPEIAKSLPPLAELGDDRSGLFQTRTHGERMLGLEKAHNEAELRAFHTRLTRALGREDLAYVVEPKFDGLAISVTFEQGQLVRAVTRGNGTEGDDVTANVLQIRELPRKLLGEAWPARMELRGEVYVPFEAFERINAEREAAGHALFANPRNLAAGTLRQLNAREVARRGLRIVFFGLGGCEPREAAPESQGELHAAIARWGLPGVPETWRARGVEELVTAVDACGRAREEFAFPLDGAVVKLDSTALQREAGASESAVRWALAYKFAPERVETELLAITLQIGRTGVLTPVAELAPVSVAGSTIARATLHNREEIRRRDIRVGDTVYLEKAGDVIPAIVGVNLARRPASARPFVFPDHCPGCHAEVVQRHGEVAVRCLNRACPAQLRRRLEHFVSKDGVAIEGLGPALIESLVTKGKVRDVPDLYALTRADWLGLSRQSERTADRLLKAIEASKTAEMWRFIHGLGIRQVGLVGARELARTFGSLEALAAAEPAERAVIEQLLAAGVRPVNTPPSATRLTGRTLVLTGTLPTLTRAQAAARIEAAGGKVGSAVSRTTDYVVAGAEPGVKLEQAQRLGIRVIDEAGLMTLIEEP